MSRDLSQFASLRIGPLPDTWGRHEVSTETGTGTIYQCDRYPGVCIFQHPGGGAGGSRRRRAGRHGQDAWYGDRHARTLGVAEERVRHLHASRGGCSLVDDSEDDSAPDDASDEIEETPDVLGTIQATRSKRRRML